MRQRIIIAIALLLDPDIIIADEPTTALDVTIQAEIMALLLELCEQHNVGLILITHDLGVVSQVTQRMLVMYAGRVIEQGPSREIINDPQHPYTQGLINALPQMATPGEKLNQIRGSMPSLSNLPSGCAFHPRCDFINRADGQPRPACTQQVPDFVESGNCRVACHMVAEMLEDRRLKEETL
jgi:peptide/nickel transport system ATP-binding protein